MHADMPLRLTKFEDILCAVRELQKFGVTGKRLYSCLTEIGSVDLDMLNAVLMHERPAG